MKKRRLIFLITGLLLIIVPFFIDVYTIFKIITLGIGMLSVEISFLFTNKKNIFLLIYLPIILIMITYALDYIFTYTFNTSPIYVLENKINSKVSIYNSIFYRIFKCDQEYIFDNNYEKGFVCNPKLISNIDINTLLNEPEKSYKQYKNTFIKVTGKISKINGSKSIELKEYIPNNGSINGYVEFNDEKVLLVNLENNIINNKIYDYITVVGLLKKYENKLVLTDILIEDNNLYDNYTLEVIEKSKCIEELTEYADSLYTKCIDKIYLDYKIDKYELSYALKDKRIDFKELTKNATLEQNDNFTVYKLEKYNILACNENKNIILSKNEKIDYSMCE